MRIYACAAGKAFSLMELLTVIAIVGVLAALAVVAVSQAITSARGSKCLSNQRQIGIALLTYASDHEGDFPPTTHTTGSRKKDQSWIYELAPYLGEVDEIRICPADPPARQDRIRRMNATSYVLNDLVFDSPRFNGPHRIPQPANTMLLFILSESRAPSTTRDHIHGAEWGSWTSVLNDIEPDRHRTGARAPDRLAGSANYLFADGHAENLAASRLKEIIDRGTNPAAVPLD